MRSNKLWRQYIRRLNYKKVELKKIILEGIINNNNIVNNKRVYASFKKVNLNKNKFFNHVESCIISGKSRGNWKFCDLGRHKINELNKVGDLPNLKASSW
jgi:hypothetical protein